MTRGTIVALLLLLVSIAGVIYAGLHQMDSDRAWLADRMGLEALQQVEKAGHIIRDDLNRISEELLFAAQIAETEHDQSNKISELERLLTVAREYEILRFYGDDGGLITEVLDPGGIPEGDVESTRAIAAATASIALGRNAGESEVTMPIPVANQRAVRVFAVKVPRELRKKSAIGAVTIVVDTEPLFGKLRLVASNPTSHILFLAAHGQPARLSDPTLATVIKRIDAGAEQSVPAFKELIDRMRSGDTGTMRIPESEGSVLGMPDGELVAAYAAIHSNSRESWSFATLNSMVRVRTYQHALVLKLATATGALALILVGFGVYLVLEARRAGMMRQRLLLADRLGHLHEKLQKIVDNIPTGVIAISSSGTITMVNQMLREKLDDITGGTLAQGFEKAPRTVVAKLETLVDDAIASKKVQSLHGERLSLFGKEGQYSVHAVPLEAKFDDARVVVVLEDQSEVGALSSQLIRAEKLATVGVLAAGIAHEIGTPLGVVRGRAEYILGKLGPEHPQAPGMRVIVEQIDFVTRTIRQLLDFSRVKRVTVHPVSVAAAARTVAELLRYESERRKISVILDIPDGLDPLAADADQLQQVIVSLTMNALDACTKDGHVRLVARAAPNKRIQLEVIDDGCGISKENKSQVFDPFFTTKKRGQGTGLGLTIAAQIVRNHGGDIELESEEGRGTRITVRWPCARNSVENEHRDGSNAI